MNLLELLVSMALTATVGAAAMTLLSAGQTIARTQPEAADLHQRGRVGLQVLGGDLRSAGAGLDRGSHAGGLIQHFPPIVPGADGGVTIWTVLNRDAQGAAASAIAPGATAVALQDTPGCPSGESACAFSPGMGAILFDGVGCRDALRIAAVGPGVLVLQTPVTFCAYAAGAAVAEGAVRTYRVDPASRQLLRRDEITGNTVPVLDDVASMQVEYFDDPLAPDPMVIGSEADLMRLRRVRATLRFVSSNVLLKIPDLVIAVDVTPPNLRND